MPKRATPVDSRLGKALSHPLRAQVLAILNEQVASPNEIAELLNERLPNVSYHVRTLLDLKCIELVSTAQRRGAIEHYYRAIERPFSRKQDWKRLPRTARQAISHAGLDEIFNDVSEAVAAGTFDARPDRALSYTPLRLDDQGWRELNKALDRLVAEAERISRSSAQRLRNGDEPGRPTRLVVFHFEMPVEG
jgi:DNA-binding transcriptional ArsR family regulator